MAKSRPEQTEEVVSAPDAGYTVLARRYRPQGFESLVGQKAVADALSNAIKSGRIGHAYMFTGPRGVGKTSAARIMARALNCEKGPTPEPCGKCQPCERIARGDEVDVIEIDGASNNDVESIRDLRANTAYLPAHCKFKIYIIDEVHMLSNSSFNALLKTLEEPPAHVKFILATTDIHKVIPTILSRCQRFDFRAIGTSAIAKLLGEIVAKENREAEPEALTLIARQASGSMRDGQSLLDQALAFTSGTLTAQAVHELLGTGNDEMIAGIAQAIMDERADEVLRLLDNPNVSGVSPRQVLEQMASWWRDLMVVQAGGSSMPDLNVAPRFRDTLIAMAPRRDMEATLAGLEVLDHGLFRLRDSTHPRLLLELTLVRMARLAQVMPVAQLAQSLLQTGGQQRPATAPAARPMISRPAAPEPPPKKASAGDQATGPESPAPQVTQQQVPKVQAPRSPLEAWPDVLAALGPMLGGKAGKATLKVRAPNATTLFFPSSARASYDYLMGAAARVSKISELLSQHTGNACTVSLELEEGAETPSDNAQGTPEPEVKISPVARRLAKDRAELIPLVRHAVETFRATIVQADENFGQSETKPA